MLPWVKFSLFETLHVHVMIPYLDN
uniref:Uncharacterized protein n=1 Tax=Rhizophora mucronata TaxID=61149 RepID=A0A2P2PZN1_RHIMU